MEQLPTKDTEATEFSQWKGYMQISASFPNIYMRLSGLFSEIDDQSPSKPMNMSDIIDRVMSWVKHVLDYFKIERTMFGSD
jgi:L-rhamnono-1,4-lactonase